MIIGFAAEDADATYLYEYEELTSDPHRVQATNINPYLVDGSNLLISSR